MGGGGGGGGRDMGGFVASDGEEKIWNQFRKIESLSIKQITFASLGQNMAELSKVWSNFNDLVKILAIYKINISG